MNEAQGTDIKKKKGKMRAGLRPYILVLVCV